MKEIKRDNAIINYQMTGDGDKTILFVHGSYFDQSYWASQVDFFKKNYTVITMDLPGHGKSGRERNDWSVRGFGEDVTFLMKELELKNVILIGHSLGADINLYPATDYPEPVIGFIAIDILKNAATPLPAQYQQQAETIVRQLATDFSNTNEQYAKMVLLTPETAKQISERVIEAYRNAWQPMGIATTPEIFKMYEEERKLLPKLKFKLYLVNVDYMPTNEAPLKQYTKNGYEVLHMKGTCHYPMLENPDQLNSLLERAINEIIKEQKH